jgi:hypothetical protein
MQQLQADTGVDFILKVKDTMETLTELRQVANA